MTTERPQFVPKNAYRPEPTEEQQQLLRLFREEITGPTFAPDTPPEERFRFGTKLTEGQKLEELPGGIGGGVIAEGTQQDAYGTTDGKAGGDEVYMARPFLKIYHPEQERLLIEGYTRAARAWLVLALSQRRHPRTALRTLGGAAYRYVVATRKRLRRVWFRVTGK